MLTNVSYSVSLRSYSNRKNQNKSYLLFDNKLNFNQHIHEMSKKATNLLNLYRHKTVYNMIVRPHLEYVPICWNPYTKYNIDKLEAVQLNDARFYQFFMIVVQLPMSVEKSKIL